MRTPLVVAARDITGKLAEHIAQAGAQARMRIHVWKGANDVELPGDPALVLAELPAGERRIPEYVLDLLVQRCPDARVLLLSHDPLVRPTVMLQDGRVTLLGPPFEPERIAEQMRLLAAANRRRRSPTLNLTAASHEETAPVVVREHLRATYWIARIGAQEPDSEAEMPLPLVHEHALDGLLAIFPLPLGESAFDQDPGRVVSALRTDGDVDERERAVRNAVGDRAALVHLNPTSDAWTFYWPSGDAPLWLYSPLRLPSWWDLSAALVARGRMLTALPAYAGDLVVGLSSWGPLERDAGAGRDRLEDALAGGSPAMVELIHRRLCLSPRVFSAALVEVR